MFIDSKLKHSSVIIGSNQMKFCIQIVHAETHGKIHFVVKATQSFPGPLQCMSFSNYYHASKLLACIGMVHILLILFYSYKYHE